MSYGVANRHSIAYGCAKAFRELGAELAITYVNEKTRGFVEPIAENLAAPIFVPLDVSVPGLLGAVFETIEKQWGELDILVHSIARAPKERPQGKADRLLRRRFPAGDGRLVPTRSSAWRGSRHR